MHIVKSKHPAVRYAHDVLDGKVVSGRHLRLAVERDLHDLEHRSDTGLIFDPELAERAIRWYGLCRQYDGEWEGKPLDLQPWQQWVTWMTYGWLRPDGTRRFRQRWIEVGSGNGKTTWMGGDALFLLVADGEGGAEVYSVAVQSEQARILWGASARMVEQSPELQRLLELFDSVNNHRITFAARNAFFVPLGRDSRTSSAEGKKPHGLLFDEVHEYKDRKQVDVLKKKMVKRRQPLATFITTAGDDEPETLYEEMHDYAETVLEGWKTAAFVDDSFLSVIFAIDADDEPFAEDMTEAGMLEIVAKANPNLGVSVKTDAIVEHWRRAHKVAAERNTFLRYSCNRRASTIQREIEADEWDACAVEVDWDAFQELPCISAVDLSSTVDLTAITQCWRSAGFWWYRFHAFMPEEAVREATKRDMVPYDRWAEEGWLKLTPGNHIDDVAIARFIREINEQFWVVQWTADDWHMKFVINALQRGEDAVEVVNFLQDIKRYAEPSMHFLDELHTGQMRHDGNPVARWCATNLITKEDSHGNRIPHKRASKKRIDPIVAGIMARGRAIVLDLESAAKPEVWDGKIEFVG